MYEHVHVNVEYYLPIACACSCVNWNETNSCVSSSRGEGGLK